jgi:hypothetical protein
MADGNAVSKAERASRTQTATRIPNAEEFLKVLDALEAEFKEVLDPAWSEPPAQGN